MDNHGTHYYQIQNGIMEHRTLSLGAKLTYGIIRRSEMYAIDKGKAKNGYFWLTRAAIASKLNRSLRKISDYIKELVDAGVIQRRCIPSNHNGLVIHDYFRIVWEVVKDLERETPPSDAEEESGTDIYYEDPNEPPELEEHFSPWDPYEDPFIPAGRSDENLETEEPPVSVSSFSELEQPPLADSDFDQEILF